MDITKVTFPLYKLRSYINIENTLMGKIKVTTIKGIYILDDTSYKGTFEERRIKIAEEYPTSIYKLKEKVLYLRQLVKYKSGTTFIDFNGNIIKYKKSTKLFKIVSKKIIRKQNRGNWTIITVENLEQSMIVGLTVSAEIKYASIMHTNWGTFLYDLTTKQHDPYKRKL